MKILVSALCATALSCAALGCSGGQNGSSSSSGAPLANGCTIGTHKEMVGGEEHCVDNSICHGVPCADGGVADGGRLDDGGLSGGDGSSSSGGLQCLNFCYLLTPDEYYAASVDGGVQYRFTEGGGLIPSDPSIPPYEVGIPDPRGLKVCFSPAFDTDGDGVPNGLDNCWLHPNKRPTCISDDGCEKAGGTCVPAASGSSVRFCNGQIDPNGDGRGVPCQQFPDERDPDCDSDGIRNGQDVCPETGTSLAENVPSSCM